MKTLIFFLLPLCALLPGCEDQSPPAGVVATVNGEPIYLHSLEAMLDSGSPDHGAGGRLSVEDMRKSYVRAFAALLARVLARQELSQRGIEITANDPRMRAVRDEMGEEGLSFHLAEASIRKDDWEALTRDSLALETFRKREILPQISVSLDEIRAYYESRQEDFKLPPFIRACFLSAPEKAEVEKLCEGLDAESLERSPLALCADMDPASLPPPWLEEQPKARLNECGKIREENGVWRSLAVLSRSEGKSPSPAELYALIEKILLERKEKAAFEKWLAEKAASSVIMVAPELNLSLSLVRDGAPAPQTGKREP